MLVKNISGHQSYVCHFLKKMSFIKLRPGHVVVVVVVVLGPADVDEDGDEDGEKIDC